MTIQDQTKAKMTAAIEHFKNSLKNIRTGRANPGMVDSIQVEVYGSPMRLKDIASISTPESRQLLITPFDIKSVGAIAKAIEKSNLGFMPIADGNAVRIKIPPMTEEIRKKMIKICDGEKEEAKIVIRNLRREANDFLKKQKSEGNIAEDMVKKSEKLVQELTDKFCKEIDDLASKKEVEISTI